ncbi:MAG TPA: sugar phosphate isomerase/epimerase [Streptosporangiaceae bacterium]
MPTSKLTRRSRKVPTANAPSGHPLALQLYSVREHLPADRKGVLRRIAAAGYGAVEAVNVTADPSGLRAELDAVGLSVCSVHANPTAEQAADIFAATRTLGTDTIIVPFLPPARFADAAGVADVAAELNQAAARAADAGFRLGYHNHDFELSTVVDGRPALEVLVGKLDDAVLLEVDTYWAAVGGQDVPALLGRLGDRVRYLHVKDGPINKEEPMTAVGAGRMPVADILAAAPSAAWHIVELDRCGTDMLTAVKESAAWLVSQGLAEPVRRDGGAA